MTAINKVTIVKNKSGNFCDINNYKPIALATIMSKLFDSVILLKCGTFLEAYPNQFGFKRVTVQKCSFMF